MTLSLHFPLIEFLFKTKTRTNMNFEKQSFDVIIIGGSYAGLSAAMALGRAVRDVLIIDSGKPCNRQTPHSHNFITQDGQTPAAIAKRAKKQVLDYPTVDFTNDKAVAVDGANNNFSVTTASGKVYGAQKILFATGVKDIMPDIPGFAECWGISVIHCPYCHGYEVRGANTGILTNGETTLEFGRLINHWTKHLTIYTNGKATFDKEQQQKIIEMNIKIVEKGIKAIEHRKGMITSLLFTDGGSMPIEALYAHPSFVQHSEIPQQLGCKLTEQGHIETDDLQQTTVPGIYAAGDNSDWMRSVSIATAAGTKAGAFINHGLIQEKSEE